MSWDPGASKYYKGKIHAWLKFLRIEQTFFSLPNVYLGAFVSLMSVPSFKILILMFLAQFFLRTAGMANDNLADREIDSRNPRTMNRPLVTGIISVKETKILIALCLILFLIISYLINFNAFVLSPIVALIVMIYPYIKRYSSFANYYLGIIQGLALMGGAVASIGNYNSLLETVLRVPWLFFFSVIFWLVGFDLYNHIPDIDFDKKMGLHSLAVLLGDRALLFAGINQLLSFSIAFIADYFYGLGIISYLSTALHGLIMLIAYIKASKGDFGKAFTYNIYSSLILGIGVCLDITLIHYFNFLFRI